MGKIKGINVDYPIGRGSTGFFKQTFDTLSARKSNILVLLKTITGERTMNTKFGIGIDKYLFEPITDDTNYFIETEIRNKIAQYIPDINIDELDIIIDFDTHMNRNKIEIKLSFSLIMDPDLQDNIIENF